MHIKTHSAEKPNRSMQAGCAVFQVNPYRFNKHCDFVYNYRSSSKMHIKTQFSGASLSFEQTGATSICFHTLPRAYKYIYQAGPLVYICIF